MVGIMKLYIILVFVVLILGCVGGPNPVVLSENAGGTLQGFNWVTVVSADIKNQGDSGDVRVIATVQVPNGGTLTQEQTIYIDENYIKSVRFTFDTKYGDKVYYSVTAEPR